jgi:L,D-transpeptidase ErfK/SrfK
MRWTLSPQSQRAQRVTMYWSRRFIFALLGVAALTAAPALAAEFPLAPGQTVVGQLQYYIIKKGEVFGDIARRFDVGYTELVTANPGVDPWVALPGTRVTIPSLYVVPAAPRRGIVLNLGQYRLFYYPPDGTRVLTYPVGLGVRGWKTPLGTTRIVRKEPNPTWIPPASMRRVEPNLPAIVPPGPNNPLGAFALHLGWPRILLHGTDRPDGVGRNVSHGCVHIYPEDIAQLFKLVSVGTPVRAIDEPIAAGWAGNRLYLTVHPDPKQVQQIDLEEPVTRDPATGVRELVRIVAGPYAGAVDWRAVDRAAAERTNMPVVVADRSAAVAGAQPASAPAAAAPVQPAQQPASRQDFGRDVEQAYARAIAQQQAGGAAPSNSSAPARNGTAPGGGARPPAVDPAQSPPQLQQSFDRATQLFEREEHMDDGR